MADRLQVGMTFKKSLTVTEPLTAAQLHRRGIYVMSTPEMVRLVEHCALEGVQPYLQSNQNSVGTRVDLRHLGGTPMGMRIMARTTLVEMDRRRLVFQAEVHDELEKVGEGTHERFIVDAEKHLQRIQEKHARWRPTG
ncbi:MAG TPA: thioesterase family protein [Candidatus Methylomirabilis sp.]|nr:thioesterase family protein [Candidatus Methylomirabilis sp.]